MLKGKKVVLRLIQSEDEVIETRLLYNSIEQREERDHIEISSATKRLEQFRKNGLWTKDMGIMLIIAENQIVGEMSFNRVTEFDLAIGYRLYKKIHRNKGYMSEALEIFSRYLFDSIPMITRLSLYTAKDNEISRRLAEKCSFVQEGILRQAYFYRGQMHDWVLYSLLRSEL